MNQVDSITHGVPEREHDQNRLPAFSERNRLGPVGREAAPEGERSLHFAIQS